ncbi:MAG TPA: hypothetical protein PKD12_19500 [Nitrospira sp.]|nr:hypothetical protein [Nitrospira sp.]
MLEEKSMLPKVRIGRRCGAIQANLNRYRALRNDEVYEELVSLGKELEGVKICHLNSTAAGDGVAELLARVCAHAASTRGPRRPAAHSR